MGLFVHNLGHLPADDTRQYFVYVLDYGWHEPLADTLMANFRNMARMASETKSVVVAGIEPIHFANEVFSWHGITKRRIVDFTRSIRKILQILQSWLKQF